MELPITTPALLFPAIAILMLGYVNRYIGVAGVIRGYKRDHDNGIRRSDLLQQLTILRKRTEALKFMLLSAATALMLSCLSMFFIFVDQQTYGEIVFGTSLTMMIISLILSIYETSQSNKSLHMEIKHMLGKTKKAN